MSRQGVASQHFLCVELVMRARQLIKALGGPTVLASTLGMRVATVGNWGLRNTIPRRHHLTLWRLALAKGLAWTPPDFIGMTFVAPPSPANDAVKQKTAAKPRKRAAKPPADTPTPIPPTRRRAA
jgi:hypothetical protein